MPVDVVRNEDGTWDVIDKDGKVLITCSTEKAAWNWFDKLSQ